MRARYPGYSVLDKRNTLSWNEVTRRAIDRRLAVHPGPRYLDAAEWATLQAICARILPQPNDRPAVPIAAYVDEKLFLDKIDGYRAAELPSQGEAWRTGLAALDAAAREEDGQGFHELAPTAQDTFLKRMQTGNLDGPSWRGMPPRLFFSKRVLHDIASAYYAHPTAWSEIGFGGPASPRGYVRLDVDQRDPWEAAEAHPGDDATARRENHRVV